MSRITVLNQQIDVLSLAETAARVADLATLQSPSIVLHRDANGALWVRKDARVRAAAEQATLVLPDGMPLVWLARAAGARTAERVYGPDLMEAVMAGPPLRHILVGGDGPDSHGRPAVAELLATCLSARFPHQTIAGILVPQVNDPTQPDAELAATMDALKADVAWIALGCPKQDLWMATHRPILRTPVLIGVGAAFNFLSGTLPQAPRWMQRSGLEWAFRCATDPRRMTRRYIKTVPHFALLAAMWLLRGGARGVLRRLGFTPPPPA